MSLCAYNVPKEERDEVVSFVLGLDIQTIANAIMQKLFEALAMRFEFELGK